MNLEITLLKLKKLLNNWNLGGADWFLVLHYADKLNGYDIKYERDEHLHIMIPTDLVPWRVDKDYKEGEVSIPANTKQAVDFQKFIKETGWDFHVLAVNRKLFDKLKNKHVVERDIHREEIPVITMEGNFVYWRYSVPMWSKQLSRDSVLRRFAWMDALLEKAREKGDGKIVKMAEDLINRFKPTVDSSKDVSRRMRDFERSDKLFGISAFKGKAVGVVFKVENSDRPPKVEKNKILVAKLISPKLLPHILVSRAVVTDEGGLASHAAIVSRELKKICIVGTKIATKVLKDGDMVWVDANNGFVQKIFSFRPSPILSLPWRYYISRNVPLWHDSLQISLGKEGCERYGLPCILHLRTHRHGEEADFYYLSGGKYGRDRFSAALAKKLSRPDFIKFIKKQFKKDCAKLLRLARSLKSDSQPALSNFFHFYGLSEAMLDITSLGSKLLTDKVWELLADNRDRQSIAAYYTRPAGLAPMQKLERELGKLCCKKIDIKKEAERLRKRYSWIPVNFVGEPWGAEEFEKKIIEHEISSRPKLKKPGAKISKEAEYYLRMLSDIAYFNEFRKAAFSRACLIIRPKLDALAREHGLLSWRDFNYLTHDEILDLAKNKDGYQKKLIERRSGICFIANKTVSKYFVSEDLDFIRKFERKFKPKSVGVKEIHGTPAHGGKAAGVAKIINGPVDFDKFRQGDILIAKMTSVDFIPIMKRAGAFVTDEGGLACHAAIISREYDKPCVVGTGLATVVFRDGDIVEVDANAGVVRKV